MRVVDEIREGFASIKKTGIREILSLSFQYPAYVIRIPDGYGVAIAVDDNIVVSERFNSCRFNTKVLGINGYTHNYLILSCAFEEFRHEFAALCTEFVEPGEEGSNRRTILDNPLDWWSKWKELVGNTSREQRIYNVIAEMLVLEHLFKTDFSIVWTATKGGSHDIEGIQESYEVKSTLKRYGASITISGQYQLECNRKLWLYFCRMEESLEGVSINDMKEKLISSGYDGNRIEIELERQGFEYGSSVRNKKYKAIEIRKYEVNNSFPKIVKESFKNDRIPDAIIHIEYTIDLDGLDYEVVKGNEKEDKEKKFLEKDFSIDGSDIIPSDNGLRIESEGLDAPAFDNEMETLAKADSNVTIIDDESLIAAVDDEKPFYPSSDSFLEGFKEYCEYHGYTYFSKAPIVDESCCLVYVGQREFHFELRVIDTVMIYLGMEKYEYYLRFKAHKEQLEEILGERLCWLYVEPEQFDENFEDDEDVEYDDDSEADDEEYDDDYIDEYDEETHFDSTEPMFCISCKWNRTIDGKDTWHEAFEWLLGNFIDFHNAIAEVGLLYIRFPRVSDTNSVATELANSSVVKFAWMRDTYGVEKAKEMMGIQFPIEVTKNFDYELMRSIDDIPFSEGVGIKALSEKLGISLQTINGWYRWRMLFPHNSISGILPDFMTTDDYPMVRYWSPKREARFNEFMSAIPDRIEISNECETDEFDFDIKREVVPGCDFMDDFRSYCNALGYRFKAIKKVPKNSVSSYLGRDDYYIIMENRTDTPRISVYVNDLDAVRRLSKKREAFEKAFGSSMKWKQSGDKIWVISCEKKFEIADFKLRRERFIWLLEAYIKMIDALAAIGEMYVRFPRLKVKTPSPMREVEALMSVDKAVLIHDYGHEEGERISCEKYGNRPFDVPRGFDFDLLNIVDDEEDRRTFPKEIDEMQNRIDEQMELIEQMESNDY